MIEASECYFFNEHDILWTRLFDIQNGQKMDKIHIIGPDRTNGEKNLNFKQQIVVNKNSKKVNIFFVNLHHFFELSIVL